MMYVTLSKRYTETILLHHFFLNLYRTLLLSSNCSRDAVINRNLKGNKSIKLLHLYSTLPTANYLLLTQKEACDLWLDCCFETAITEFFIRTTGMLSHALHNSNVCLMGKHWNELFLKRTTRTTCW